MEAVGVGRFPRVGMPLFINLRMDGKGKEHKRADPVKQSHCDSHTVTS